MQKWGGYLGNSVEKKQPRQNCVIQNSEKEAGWNDTESGQAKKSGRRGCILCHSKQQAISES